METNFYLYIRLPNSFSFILKNTVTSINNHFIVIVTPMAYSVLENIVEFLESMGFTNLVFNIHTHL